MPLLRCLVRTPSGTKQRKGGEMPMKRVFPILAALLALGAGSVMAQHVRYNFDKSANFSGYRTYKWAEIKGSDKVNQITENQIKTAIETELLSKGLTKI